MDKEIWKDIEGYEGLYQVSNLGRVKSLKRITKIPNAMRKQDEKIIKPKTTGYYYHVKLCKNGQVKNFTIHRLVAKTFIPNPENLPCINHKDENKLNNVVSNLEWCTYKYNNNYGNRVQKASQKQQKQINQYDLRDNFIKCWNSINEAIRFYKNRHIWDASVGKRKTASGFKWEFKEKQ